MSDELYGVDGWFCRLKDGAVFRKRTPCEAFAKQSGPIAGKPRFAVARHHAAAALSVHLGGDALAQLAWSVRFKDKIGITVAVGVNETRRYDTAGDVY